MKIKDLQAGDLLFFADQSEMGQAIQVSTGKYSHVGIYLQEQLYHATHEKGVVYESLVDYLKKEMQVCHVYRYERVDVAQVLAKAQEHIGKPYNDSFYPGQSAFYCSSLVAELVPIFSFVPMSFSDGKQAISDFWQAYYDDLGLDVPVGVVGTNPSQLAKCPDLQYVGECRLDAQ